MTDKRFRLAYEKGNEAIFEDLAKYPYPRRMTNKEVERKLNEQQATISALKEENMGLRAKHTQMVIIMKDVVKDLKRIDTYRYAEHLEKIANLRFLSEKELDDE